MHGKGFISTGLAALVLSGVVVGCGGGSAATSSTTSASHGSLQPVSAPQPPPIADATLTTGSPEQQIAQTIVAFYRAAWQDDAARACSLFSSNGRAGFMHAAHVSFPQGVSDQSNCSHAMKVYSAALADSVTNTQQNDAAFPAGALNNVRVAEVRVHGASATALAPTNVAELINPKQISLVLQGRRWLIDGSRSINASNLTKILQQAKARGELTPRP